MYDSITASNIPMDAVMVGGYMDGKYKWSDADWARFPHAVKVQITVFPQDNVGVVLDVENGDANPDQAPAWVAMRRSAGVIPSVYCNAGNWNTVKAAFQAANVPDPFYWIANYPGGGAVVPDGAVAHQYQDVGPYDLSAVANYWPGVDKVVDMFWFVTNSATQETALLLPNGDLVGAAGSNWVALTQVNAVPNWTVPQAVWDDLKSRRNGYAVVDGPHYGSTVNVNVPPGSIA